MDYKDLIFKHLHNTLSQEEELLFTERLKTDVAFKKEVTFQRNLKSAITNEDSTIFRNLITKIEQDAKTASPKKSKKSFLTKWMAVASIVLALGFGYIIMQQNRISYDQVFTENFEPYRNVVAPIVRGELLKDTKSLAFMAYEKGDYKIAEELFSKLYVDSKEPYYLFYKANALLKLNRSKEAIPLLEAHLKTNGPLTQKTTWYLALAYLKNEDTQKAITYLKQVVTDKLYNYKDAENLLKTLN